MSNGHYIAYVSRRSSAPAPSATQSAGPSAKTSASAAAVTAGAAPADGAAAIEVERAGIGAGSGAGSKAHVTCNGTHAAAAKTAEAMAVGVSEKRVRGVGKLGEDKATAPAAAAVEPPARKGCSTPAPGPADCESILTKGAGRRVAKQRRPPTDGSPPPDDPKGLPGDLSGDSRERATAPAAGGAGASQANMQTADALQGSPAAADSTHMAAAVAPAAVAGARGAEGEDLGGGDLQGDLVWWRVSDTHVKAVDWDTVARGEAYILMYMKDGGRAR